MAHPRMMMMITQLRYVPAIDSPISDLDYDALQQAIDPLAPSDSFGIYLFTSTMQFVYNLL